MAEAKGKAKSVEFKKYKITKSNGKVIFRDKNSASDIKLKRLKAKGWKVEEV
jgi:hypothetical protein|tara:strand:- start:525 stop:680 length:156 start_codon:yes stop_codon:yes gene_type:complete